ncbi:hypothetical protein J7I93_01295 [Bacillus sp. ISL-47]|uniref:hypothetical protein n=1 Tax=Bacillus sp. ISL-47 TaxID=2819130 RepID=UPI001BE89A62|nr:hypothetical protein [Bacillus sp. ISL-47]MBT2686810.1 hypothetical protein [Bacillus sp. ISL-47]MBT2706837.1 hypothetical protein [Pseudomonas sp. ISL-84]
MWILTLFLQDSIKMFEYDNKDEARVEFEKADGCKILSEIIHYVDFEKEGKVKRGKARTPPWKF